MEPKELIVEFLRSRLTDPRSRNFLKTETFTGDGSTTEYTLSPDSDFNIFYIKSIKVDGSELNKWEDYTFDTSFQDKTITFSTAPSNGSSIEITYGQGTTSWIYPDLAKVELSASQYPRINVLVINSTGTRLGNYTSDIGNVERYQVDIWVKENYYYTYNNRVYEGDKLAMLLARQISEAFKNYINDLYPKLHDYRYLNLRDAVWEVERQCFHVIFEFEIRGENLGE